MEEGGEGGVEEGDADTVRVEHGDGSICDQTGEE